MAQSISGRIKLQAVTNFIDTLDLSTVSDSLAYNLSKTFTNGTGADRAQIQWHDRRTLATTATDNIDLAGSLTAAFGTTATFTKVKWLIIAVATTTAGATLRVGGAAANQFSSWVADPSDAVNVGAGGVFALGSPVDGYTVTAGTGDILKIYNPSAGDVTYDIIVIGEGSLA